MSLPYYGYRDWQVLKYSAPNLTEKWEAQVREKFDLDLDVVAGVYVDDGEVVGAIRYLLNDKGHKYAIGNDAAVELVGRDS